MKQRGVAVLGALAVVLAALAAGALLRFAIPYAELAELTSQPTNDPSAFEAYWMEMNTLYVYQTVVDWIFLAALLAGVAALALAARRAQLAQAGSASATVSREAARDSAFSSGSAESSSRS